MKFGIATTDFISSVNSFLRLREGDSFEVVKEEKIADYDLIVFSGGEDISPILYGQKNYHSYVNHARDAIEIRIFRLAKEHNIKMFGICRGHQFLNALSGGTLIQDIQTVYGKGHGGIHRLIIVEPESAIGKIYTEVNSMHHQGVVTAGKDLKVTSVYNGVIESTEGKNIISVQWHPEFMLDSQADKLSEYLRKWAMEK